MKWNNLLNVPRYLYLTAGDRILTLGSHTGKFRLLSSGCFNSTGLGHSLPGEGGGGHSRSNQTPVNRWDVNMHPPGFQLTIWRRPKRTCGRAWRRRRWDRAGRSWPPTWPMRLHPESPACWSRSHDLRRAAHSNTAERIRQTRETCLRLAQSLTALSVSRKFSLFGTKYNISSVTLQPVETTRGHMTT